MGRTMNSQLVLSYYFPQEAHQTYDEEEEEEEEEEEARKYFIQLGLTLTFEIKILVVCSTLLGQVASALL